MSPWKVGKSRTKAVAVALLSIVGIAAAAGAATLAAAHLYPPRVASPKLDGRFPPRGMVVRSKPGVLHPDSEADCAAHQGSWHIMGASGRAGCDMPNSDAGHTCTDSRDCEGFCEVPDSVARGAYTSGRCTDRRPALGCRNIVSAGRAWDICYD